MPTTPTRRPVRKAADALPIVAYDKAGNVVGVIMDPTNLLPVANADAGTAIDRDMTPMPPGEVGIPADAVDDGVTKLRKAVYRAADPAEQNAAAQRLNAAAIVKFQEIRRRPRGA